MGTIRTPMSNYLTLNALPLGARAGEDAPLNAVFPRGYVIEADKLPSEDDLAAVSVQLDVLIGRVGMGVA